MTNKQGKGIKFFTFFCTTILSVLVSSQVRAQSEFDEAHTLLMELDAIQKSGRRDSASMGKLNQMVNRAQMESRGLVNKGILAFLNSPGHHSSEEIRVKISNALQIVPEYTPEVFVSGAVAPQLGSYVVAYNISYCASCSNAWVGVIGKKGGRYDVLSDLDDAFANKSLHIITIHRGEDGKDRFLIYGTNWGDAHNRLTAAAYVLDNGKLRKFWDRIDLPQGTLEYSQSEITLKFLTKLEPPPTGERTEIYRVEPDGIRLKRQLEQPM